MKLKIYYEDKTKTIGGHEIVSLSKLMWWLWLGRIKVKEKSTVYFITKIETLDGKRI